MMQYILMLTIAVVQSILATSYEAFSMETFLEQQHPSRVAKDTSWRRSLASKVSEECESDTLDLGNLLGIIEANNEIRTWVDTRTFLDICFNPTPEKTSCKAEYETIGHNLQEACTVVGALYTRTTYTFKCSGDGEMTTLFYTGEFMPSCYAFSCGVEGSRQLEDERVDDLMQTLVNSGMECQRMRFNFEEPVIPVEKPKNCPEDTAFIMGTTLSNETEARNTQLGSYEDHCLVSENNWDCSIEFNTFNYTMEVACEDDGVGMYLETDYTLTCIKEDAEMTLSGFHDPLCVSRTLCRTEDFQQMATNHATGLVDIVQQDGWACEIADLSIEDFVSSSAPTISAAPTVSAAPSSSPTASTSPSVSFAPSQSPTVVTCLDGSIALNETDTILNETVAIQAKVDKQPLGSYCRYPVDTSADPYVVTCEIEYTDMEHDMQQVCEEQGGLYVEETLTIFCEGANSTEIHLNYINRPACRHTKCNGKEIKEVAAYGVEWLRNKGLASDEGQTCTVEDIQVAIGGHIEGDDGNVKLSEECVSQSNELDSIIAIFNQKDLTRKDFMSYISVDLRSICRSPVPAILECGIDYAEEDFTNDIQDVCATNGGQYVESAFVIECYNKDEKDLFMTSENVPSCIGRVCSPGQAELFLVQEHGWLADNFVTKGYECETIILNVYAPNYNRSGSDGDIQEDIAEAPTPAADDTGPTGPTYGYDTDVALPQFGKIWNTQPPTPVPPQNETNVDADADDDDADTEEDSGLPDAAIGGMAVGFVFLLMICLVLCRFCCGGDNGPSNDAKQSHTTEDRFSDEEVGSEREYFSGDNNDDAREDSDYYEGEYDEEAGPYQGQYEGQYEDQYEDQHEGACDDEEGSHQGDQGEYDEEEEDSSDDEGLISFGGESYVEEDEEDEEEDSSWDDEEESDDDDDDHDDDEEEEEEAGSSESEDEDEDEDERFDEESEDDDDDDDDKGRGGRKLL